MNSELRKSLLLIKNAIRETKQYLNHEFRDYYANVVVLEPSEWFWVTHPYKIIENEKPNIPIDFSKRCDKLYVEIFEIEANRFIDYCRQAVKIRKDRLPETEINTTIWNQYELWRTRFTMEANSIIESIDNQLGIKAHNGIKSVEGTKVLKKKMVL
ncbi:MAG: hypothetical protein AAFO82_24890 [Bacteroidota bacterium]